MSFSITLFFLHEKYLQCELYLAMTCCRGQNKFNSAHFSSAHFISTQYGQTQFFLLFFFHVFHSHSLIFSPPEPCNLLSFLTISPPFRFFLSVLTLLFLGPIFPSSTTTKKRASHHFKRQERMMKEIRKVVGVQRDGLKMGNYPSGDFPKPKNNQFLIMIGIPPISNLCPNNPSWTRQSCFKWKWVLNFSFLFRHSFDGCAIHQATRD